MRWMGRSCQGSGHGLEVHEPQLVRLPANVTASCFFWALTGCLPVSLFRTWPLHDPVQSHFVRFVVSCMCAWVTLLHAADAFLAPLVNLRSLRQGAPHCMWNLMSGSGPINVHMQLHAQICQQRLLDHRPQEATPESRRDIREFRLLHPAKHTTRQCTSKSIKS